MGTITTESFDPSSNDTFTVTVTDDHSVHPDGALSICAALNGCR